MAATSIGMLLNSMNVLFLELLFQSRIQCLKKAATVSIPSSMRKGLTERKQAGEHLRNLRLLHCRRAEEARGYGKYLTGTLSAVRL